jgi:hypothetical protein
LVLPYHSSFWQWYTLLFVLAQTRPGPPPGAGFAGRVYESDFAAGAEDALLMDLELAAAAPAPAAGAAALLAYQSFTPPWPLQAPLLEAALVLVPSLQVPVAAPAAGGAALLAVAADLLEGAAAVAATVLMAPPAYQSFTPPWPLHAPLLLVAVVVLPSLQTPVAAPPALAVLEEAAADEPELFLVLPVDAPLLAVPASAGVLASAAAPYHFLTPSCPLHAPLLEVAEV